MLIFIFLFLTKCITTQHSECTPQEEKTKPFILKSIKTDKKKFDKQDFYFHKNGNKILSFGIKMADNKFNKNFFEFYILIDNSANKEFKLTENSCVQNSWKIYFSNNDNKNIEAISIKKIRPNKGIEKINFPERRVRFGNLYKVSFPLNSNNFEIDDFKNGFFILENMAGEILEFKLKI